MLVPTWERFALGLGVVDRVDMISTVEAMADDVTARQEMSAGGAPILQVENLTLTLLSDGEVLCPVSGVSFAIHRGETVCLVGESGSGKSLTALSIMRLIELEASVHYEGRVTFAGRELLGLSQRDMGLMRGSEIAMVPQEPMSALNPVLTIGRQLEQVGLYHVASRSGRRKIRRQFHERARTALVAVGIRDVDRVLSSYPHQLSGGMQQRVLIAMAVIAEPSLIIADEPTTALDVTTQAQILVLLAELQQRTGVGLLLITHDLAVAAQVGDRILVMYAGEVVEESPIGDLFSNPQHPYSFGLLGSVPSIDAGKSQDHLRAIPGSVPSLSALPEGCRFAPRCELALDQCRAERPELRSVGVQKEHLVACWRPGEAR